MHDIKIYFIESRYPGKSAELFERRIFCLCSELSISHRCLIRLLVSRDISSLFSYYTLL